MNTMKRVAAAGLAAAALLGILASTAGPAEARRDTNWPCAGCLR